MGHLKRGINDLQTKNPELALEWDYEKNVPLTPSDIAAGSDKKVWWICSDCGNSWSAQVYARNKGNGCPACRYIKSARSSSKTWLRNGTNTLRSFAPPFLDEWDYEKNQGLTPDDVTPKSGKKVWWKCKKCGSSYYAKILGRTAENKGSSADKLGHNLHLRCHRPCRR